MPAKNSAMQSSKLKKANLMKYMIVIAFTV